MAFDRPAQGFGQHRRLLAPHGREHDHELLAAPAHQPARRSQLAPQQRGQLPQHAVASIVAAAVVDELEVVDVQHHQRQPMARLGRQGRQPRPSLLEAMAVQRQGQRIGGGPGAVALGLVLQRTALGAIGAQLQQRVQGDAGQPYAQDPQVPRLARQAGPHEGDLLHLEVVYPLGHRIGEIQADGDHIAQLGLGQFPRQLVLQAPPLGDGELIHAQRQWRAQVLRGQEHRVVFGAVGVLDRGVARIEVPREQPQLGHVALVDDLDLHVRVARQVQALAGRGPDEVVDRAVVIGLVRAWGIVAAEPAPAVVEPLAGLRAPRYRGEGQHRRVLRHARHVEAHRRDEVVAGDGPQGQRDPGKQRHGRAHALPGRRHGSRGTICTGRGHGVSIAVGAGRPGARRIWRDVSRGHLPLHRGARAGRVLRATPTIGP